MMKQASPLVVKQELGITEKGVIRTLLYFDIFHYPLTSDEIINFHPYLLQQEAIDNTLTHLQNQSLLFKHENFYSLQSGSTSVTQRKAGNELAKKKLKTAQRFSRLISFFPFVRGVMLSGSLSKNYMDNASDIDYFIITAPKRLWLVRGMLALFKRVFLFNSHKYFCTNYFIDTESLEIEEKNLYTAMETATLIPVYGKSLYKKFMAANAWTKTYLPNQINNRSVFIRETSIWLKTLLEFFFNGKLGETADLFLMNLAVKRWKKKFGATYTQAELALAFKSARNVSKHHPQFFQKQVLDLFHDKIHRFESINQVNL
jgi:hypothetical protein